MPPQISIHDNHLAAYSVLAKEKKIVFQTEFRDREPYEFTDVIFEEVLAYHFENDLFGTIIFDIEEVDLSALLKEHAAMFEVGWRYGWPRGWEKEKEEIEVFARRLGMRAFELSSSYGMSGWVIAKCMSKIRKEANPASAVDGGITSQLQPERVQPATTDPQCWVPVMSEWKLHVPDETNRITQYKCGLVVDQRVRLKKDLAITCGGMPTGKVYHAGEEWVVLPGIKTDPVLWFRQADGERHSWDDDIASVGEWFERL